jgi:uncharacterized protein (DUF433 family)
MVSVLGNGVYGYSEAAMLTQLAPDRVREWFRNRPTGSKRTPIFRGDYEPIEGDRAISFLDLIDVFVAGQLRSHGVSLQTLRKVYRRMGGDLETSHPFCRSELLSDGKTVFMRGLDRKGETELKEVLTHQKVFPDIILPFLKKIDYSKISRLAERWHIAPHVVIDPKICFGKPVVEAVSIPTAILANAYRANHKNAKLVAEWYNVGLEHVKAAVEFETNMAA